MTRHPLYFLLYLLLATFGFVFQAQAQTLSYHGRIVDGITNVGVSGVRNFRIQIRTPAGLADNCLMYEEAQTKTLVNGVFVIRLNDGSGTRLDATAPVYALQQIFSNKNSFGSFSFAGARCTSASPFTYSPSAADGRRVYIYFEDPAAPGIWEPLPTQTVSYVPAAIEAINVSGFPIESLLRVVDGSGNPSTLPSPLSEAQYTALLNVASGSVVNSLNGLNGAVSAVAGTAGADFNIVAAGATVTFNIPTASAVNRGLLSPADWTTFNNKMPNTGAAVVSALGYTPLDPANNLSELSNVTTARGNLGLGSVATLNVPAAPATAAAATEAVRGDDPRLTGAITAGSAASGDLSGTYPNPTVATVGGRTAAQINTSVTDTLAATNTNTASTIVKRDAGGNISLTGASATNFTGNNFYIYNTGNANRVQLVAPTPMSGDYTFALPPNGGSPGYVLGTDGAGNTTWINPSSTSVTAVTASAPLASSGGFMPNISITRSNATTDGYLASTDFTTFSAKQSTDLSTGMVWVGNGSNVAAPQFLNISNIRSTVAGAWFQGAACPSGQMLTYSAITDSVTCQAYSLTGSQVATSLSGIMTGDVTISSDGTTAIGANRITNSMVNDVAWAKVTSRPNTIAGYGIIDAVLINAGGIATMEASADATRGAAGNPGRVFVSSDTGEIWYDNGAAWVRVGSNSGLGGTVTNVSANAPLSVVSPTTTPTISISRANGTTDGYLASTDWTTFNNKLNNSLANGSMWIGNGTNVPTAVTMSGDATISNTGVLTLATVTSAGTYTKVTVNAKGLVTSATNINSSDVTTALGYTPVNRAGDTMTGALNMGGQNLTNTGVIEMATNGNIQVSNRAADPGALGPADAGRFWYNSTTNELKYWNGSSVQTLGTIAGVVTGVNGLTGNVTIQTGSTGTDFNIATSSPNVTINIPTSSATNRGLLTSSDWSNFNSKQPGSTELTGLAGLSTTGFVRRTGAGTYSTTSSIDITTMITGILPIVNGGTGASTATGALNNLLPNQTGNAGRFLRTDGTNATWTVAVTSVGASAPLSITGAGTATPLVSMTQADTATDGYIIAADWNTFNNKMSSDFTNVTGTLGIANGGTGATTASGARTNLGLGTADSPTFTGLTLSSVNGNTLVKSNGFGVLSNATSTDVTGLLGFTPGRVNTVSASGAGVTIGGTSSDVTVAVNTELQGLSALASNGFVRRTGAGTYSSVASIDLTSQVTGTLPVANGGTGLTSAGANGNVMYVSGGTWATNTPDNAGLVDKASAQIISGAKSFSNNVVVTNQNQIRFNEQVINGTNYIGLQAPASVTTDLVFTLPGADGSVGQVLRTDGAGNLSWVSTATGTVTSVSATSPLSVSGVATVNPTINIARSTGSADGYLASTDFTVFSNKMSTDFSNATGTLGIARGGTGATTANAALNNLLPNQSGNSGRFLRTNGTDTSWVVAVTSIGASAPLSITGAGTATPLVSISQADTATDGYLIAADWNTFNNKMSSDFTNVSGTLGIANGGTGATTASGARTNLGLGTADSPTFTGLTLSGVNGNTLVKSNGFGVLSNATSADVTGLLGMIPMSSDFSNATGTLPVARGGTGTGTAPTNGQLLIGNGTGYTLAGLTGTANQITVTTGAGSIALSTPQDIHSGASPSFTGLTLSGVNGNTLVRSNGSGVLSNATSADVTGLLGFTPGRVNTVSASGAGVTIGGTSTDVTVAVNTELQGLSALASNGFVRRTGAGTYSSVASVDLTSQVTGTLPVANGGTGLTTPGAANNILASNGLGAWASVTGDSAGLVDKSNAQTVGGIKTFTSNMILDNAGEFRYREATVNGTNYVALKAPANMTSGDVTFTLPGADGSVGQVLRTDGAGNLSWVSTATGTVTSVSATSPLSVSGVATVNPTINIARSTGSADGYLASTDFTVFSNKMSTDFSNVTGTLGVANGGTGSTTASGARTNLGLGTGDSPTFTGLTLSGVNGNTLVKSNGSGVLSNATSADVTGLLGFTPGRVNTVSASGAGVTIGGTSSDVTVAVNAELQGLSALASNGFVRRTGAGTYSSVASVDLTSQVTGTLPVINGGTGLTTPGAANNILASNGLGAWASVTGDTAGLVDKSNAQTISGAKTMSANLTMSSPTALFRLQDSGSNTVSFRSPATVATSYTLTLPTQAPSVSGQVLAASTDGTMAWVTALTGTVGVTAGGTGLTSGTSGGIPYFSSSTTMASSAALTANGVVLGGGAGGAPTSTAAGAANSVLRVPAGGGAPVFGAIDLTSAAAVTGSLPVGNGGTGASTLTTGSLVVGNGTSAVNFLTAGTSGNVIYATGASTWASGTPTQAGLIAQNGNSYAAAVTIGTNDSNGLNLETNNSTRMSFDTSGAVQVNGQMWSQVTTSSAATPLTWNTNTSNIMRWTINTSTITANIHNMKPGGAYQLVVSGTGTGTTTINCFSDAGTTSLPNSFVPANGNRVTGTRNKTVYTLMSDGENCLITWITGF